VHSLVYSYKNGSKAREKIRDQKAGGDWNEFNRLLEETSPGNNGHIGKKGNTAVVTTGR